MKKLIIARHGDYYRQHGSDGSLTYEGYQEVNKLASFLKQHFNSTSIVMFHSPVTRCIESAEIIEKELSIKSQVSAILNPDSEVNYVNMLFSKDEENDRKRYLNNALGLIIVILVTHYEFVEKLSSHYGEKELGADFWDSVIDTGKAWLVNCETKKLYLLPENKEVKGF